MFGWMWAAVALAAPVRTGTAPIVADGATPAQVRLWVGDGAGAAKVTTDQGAIRDTDAPGDGTVVVTWIPPAKEAAGTATLTVAVGKERTAVEIPLVPPASGHLTVTMDPVVVAPGGQATLHVVPSGGTPTPADKRRIVLAASTGTLDAPVAQADGSFVAHWTAPKATTPQAAVITAADADVPSVVWGSAIARVSVHKSVAFDAPAGATATLALGGKTTDPVTAKAGKASFDLDLDPAAMTATLDVARSDGTHEQKVVMLPVGTAAVTFVPAPPVIVAGDPLTVRMAATGADGAPWTTRAPEVAVTGAKLASVKADGNGWVAELTDVVPGEVAVTATVAGQAATTKRTAIDPSARYAAKVAPDPLPATGKATATVTVTGPSAPTWTWAEGKGTAAKPASGGWTATVPLDDGASRIAGAVGPTVATRSGFAPAAVAGWSDTPVVRADGAEIAALRFAVVDPAGLPLPDAEVELSVVSGDGTLPATKLRTDALGIARATWVAGKAEGPATVRATAGGRWTEVTVLQTGAQGGPDVSPDPTGPAARWGSMVTEVAAWREGRAPSHPPVTAAVAAAPVVASGAEPKPAKVPRSGGDASEGLVALSVVDSHGGGTADGDGETYIGGASYGTPVAGFPGLRADVDWPLLDGGWGALSAAATGRARVGLYAIGDDHAAQPEIDLLAGPRWRKPGDLAPDATLSLGVLSAEAFRFGPDDVPEGIRAARFVVRPAIGLGIAAGAAELRGELGLALSPGPVGGGGSVTVDLGDGGVRPRFGLDVDHRGWKLPDDGGELAETRVDVSVGARFGG